MTVNVKEELTKKADQLAGLQQALQSRSRGSQLQVFKPMLKSLNLAADSLSLPSVGSAPLYLALSTFMIGMNQKESEAGIIGPSLNALTEALSSGITTSLMPHAKRAETQFLTMLVKASFLIIICLTTQGSKDDAKGMTGQFPRSIEGEDLRLIRGFSSELIVSLLKGSGTLEGLFNIFLEASGADEKGQQVGAAILGEVATLLILLVISEESKLSYGDLIHDEKEALKKGAKKAKEAIEAYENKGNTADPSLLVAIDQLVIALEENNDEECVALLKTLLEMTGATLEGLCNEIRDLCQITAKVVNAAIESPNEESLTNIVNIIS